MQTNTGFAYFMMMYLFVFSIGIQFLGADGLPDVVYVIFSAVIKDVLIFFPESNTGRRTDKKAQSFFGTGNYKPIKTCGTLKRTFIWS